MARKEKKFHYIYKTTNILSGKYYIGMHSTDNLEDGYMGSGDRLRSAIRKHGKENFNREILEFFDTRKELSDREEEVVNLDEISKIECMNMRVGGCGGYSKKANDAYLHKLHNDEEFRENLSVKARENNLRLIEEGKLKTWTKGDNYDRSGLEHTNETKNKMSESKKGQGIGKSNSQYGTCWITRDGENKKINKEFIDDYINDGWIRGRKVSRN